MDLGIDWAKAFIPDESVVETFVRGTVVYLSLFVLLRVVLRRQTGTITLSDLLVLVLIADAAQNAMSNDYRSITNGLVLIATLIGWNVVLDWLGYHVPHVQRFVHPERKPLVVDGRLIRRSLAQELMTEEELMTQLRLQGVEGIDEVKAVYVEGNGQVSVIKQPKAARSEGSGGSQESVRAGRSMRRPRETAASGGPDAE